MVNGSAKGAQLNNSVQTPYFRYQRCARSNCRGEAGNQRRGLELEDGSRIPEDVIEEVKEVSEGLTVDLPWQPGDFVMVDNTRMMHGRREFTGEGREVYVRMCRSVDW